MCIAVVECLFYMFGGIRARDSCTQECEWLAVTVPEELVLWLLVGWLFAKLSLGFF